MEFEDLQVIWNSQQDEPLYGVNEDGLHNTLRNNSKRFRRVIFWQHLQTFCGCTIAITAIVGLLLLNASGLLGDIGSSRALHGWEIAGLLISLLCWLQFGAFVYLGNRQQKKQEKYDTTSLRDDLDKEINRTKYQIRTRSHIMLGFVPPYFGSTLWIIIVFGVSGISYWAIVPVIAVMATALIIESRCQRRFVEQEITPRLQQLETLRETLITAPASESTIPGETDIQ
ncbi:MAG: hypothetical protein L7W43_04230 [Rubripirellula sp.]|nr:hypothetical protein [Rubripirellula sp.]